MNKINDHVISFLILIRKFVRQILTCGLYYKNLEDEETCDRE